MEKNNPQCVKCTILRCGSAEKEKKVPVSCPTEKFQDLVKETIEKLMLPENRAINEGWLALMNKTMNPEKPREKLSWT